MPHMQTDLASFGWSHHFQSQLTDLPSTDPTPARVSAVHRNGLDVIAPGLSTRILPYIGNDEDDQATVGDWLLVNSPTRTPVRLLQRKSLFKRRAAGTSRKLQLIAANVDTLFIVSSCNQDFNIARLERYLALAHEAGVMPVVVLTKADLCDNPRHYADAARKLMSGLLVECLNALDTIETAQLHAWCVNGQTVALLGSSGVGKSTLANTLLAQARQSTGAIRSDDDKGRHTTTGRALLSLPSGGWLIDTPGMRELQLTDAVEGIDSVFADIAALAEQCRFSDCRHETEPGCAVLRAIQQEQLDGDRLRRWRKLQAEERFNSQSLAESRQRSRAFGKMARRVMQEKYRQR